MASRHSPTSKIPKWNTPPPSPRVQAFASNDSKKSISATSSPRHISFRSKPAASITSGSKIPKGPSATTQNEQPQNCNHVTSAKTPIATEQEARVDVVQFGACQVGGGEGDTPATMLDPNKAKDTPTLIINDQYEEDDLDNALVGLIKPFSDRDFTKFLHISAISDDETLETIKPPDLPADYISSTNFMENVRIPVESPSSTSEKKSTPMELWLDAENSEMMVAPSILEKLHGRTEGLVDDFLKEAATKAVITRHGDYHDEITKIFSCEEKEEAPIKERNGEEDFSSQFEDLVTKLGAPTKSETQIMKQMDFEDAQLQESKSSLAEIQQVKSIDSRLRKYKIFLESSTDIDPKKSTSKPVVIPTAKTSSSYIVETVPVNVENSSGKPSQEKLSRHLQLDDHEFDVQNHDGSSTIAQEERIVREVDVSLPKIMVHEEVCECTEESQSDMEALGFGTTDSDYGNESEDGDTVDDGEDMIINLDQLNSNDAVIGKKARTIFSVDLSMSKIQVKHGAGENGDGNHNEERNATMSSRKSKSSYEAPSLPSLTRLEDPKDDSRITVVTRDKISNPESYNSVHSLYSRKYNSGQRILKKSADQVDKQLEEEESTSSDEREVVWEFEKQFDTSRDWVESTIDQKHKIWLDQGARGDARTVCWNTTSRLEHVEVQLANVNGHIHDIYDKIVYYRTVTSAVVTACVVLVAVNFFLPYLDDFLEKEKKPEPTWWESLFGSE